MIVLSRIACLSAEEKFSSQVPAAAVIHLIFTHTSCLKAPLFPTGTFCSPHCGASPIEDATQDLTATYDSAL